MLRENGLSIRDVKTATPAPQPAAQAFVAGQFACATYEPYVIVAELIGATSGIGHMIMDSQRLLDTGQMIFGIVVIGVIGLVTDFLF